MKKNKILITLLMVFVLVFFTGCQDKDDDPEHVSSASQDTEQSEDSDIDDQDDVNDAIDEETVTLYIGHEGYKYKEVGVKMDKEDIYGSEFDEELLDALEDVTSWELDLAKPIEETEGGKIISFSDESFFATGVQKIQKEEYAEDDPVALGQLMLDSIQKTFDMNLTDGNPQRSLNLYFNVMDKSIKLGNTTIPMNKSWNEAKSITFK